MGGKQNKRAGYLHILILNGLLICKEDCIFVRNNTTHSSVPEFDFCETIIRVLSDCKANKILVTAAGTTERSDVLEWREMVLSNWSR